MRAFMAECFWPGITLQKVAAAGARAHEVSHAINPAEGRARHRGSILIPTDEIALFLLDAASLDAATALTRQAAIPAERILEIVRLGAFVPSSPREHRNPAKEIQ
ncbi:MAG TPA: hypothetical protein VGU02_10560 [Gaiellaceae bacterium]|nr:hypothetical protein [Gaiellaceae bacterium]